MSSIPASAMPHAKAEPEKPEVEPSLKTRASARAKQVGDAAEKAMGKATEAVKENPKTAAAVGVAVLAAGAAAIAAPLVMGKDKAKPARKSPAKKAPAKKPAAKD